MKDLGPRFCAYAFVVYASKLVHNKETNSEPCFFFTGVFLNRKKRGREVSRNPAPPPWPLFFTILLMQKNTELKFLNV